MSAIAADRTTDTLPDNLKVPLSFSVGDACGSSSDVDLLGNAFARAAICGEGRAGRLPWAWSEMFRRFRCRGRRWKRRIALWMNTKGLYKAEPPPEIKQPPPPDTIADTEIQTGKTAAEIQLRGNRNFWRIQRRLRRMLFRTGAAALPQFPTRRSRWVRGHRRKAGMAVGDAGGGNFGSRFSWYVEAVQRRVSGNWLQSTIDPGISSAPRVIATFDILRDGTITNIQITRSSGNHSVDTSEVRAIRESSPLDRLPPGYSGSKVSVEFWFDFHR